MPTTIELEDHGSELRALNDWLQLEPGKTAVITVDMHRGHLDPLEATLPVSPEDSEAVRGQAHDLLAFCRSRGTPVIHVILVQRPVEYGRMNPRMVASRRVLSKAVPRTEAQKRGVPHNLEGSIQTQLMPEIGPEQGDYVIDTKKTLSIYQGTDLDHLLRVLGVDTVALMGINTNTCVLCGAFESANRGYRTIVVSDCTASMYGRDLHILALQNVARCLGWVLTSDELKAKLSATSTP